MNVQDKLKWFLLFLHYYIFIGSNIMLSIVQTSSVERLPISCFTTPAYLRLHILKESNMNYQFNILTIYWFSFLYAKYIKGIVFKTSFTVFCFFAFFFFFFFIYVLFTISLLTFVNSRLNW